MRNLIFAILASWVVSCTHVNCECSPTDLVISTGASRVEAMTLSGPACQSAEIDSTIVSSPGSSSAKQYNEFMPGAGDYVVKPSASGECTITITLADASVIERTVEFRYSNGDSNQCCVGYFTTDSYWYLGDSTADSGSN